MSFVIALIAAFIFHVHAMPAAEPQVTAAPDFEKRAIDPMLIGYIVSGGYSFPASCDAGYTYATSKSYAQCCPTAGACTFYTTCVGSYTAQADDYWINCGYYYQTCVTGRIYSSAGDLNPVTNFGCATSNWAVTRVVASATASTSVVFSTATPTFNLINTVSGSSGTARASSSGSSTAPLQTTNPSTTPTPAPIVASSKAWIAGVVVGPLLGLALVGAIIFFVLRRQKKNKQASAAHFAAPSNPPAPAPMHGQGPPMAPQYPSYGQQPHMQQQAPQQGYFPQQDNKYNYPPGGINQDAKYNYVNVAPVSPISAPQTPFQGQQQQHAPYQPPPMPAASEVHGQSAVHDGAQELSATK